VDTHEGETDIGWMGAMGGCGLHAERCGGTNLSSSTCVFCLVRHGLKLCFLFLDEPHELPKTQVLFICLCTGSQQLLFGCCKRHCDVAVLVFCVGCSAKEGTANGRREHHHDAFKRA